VAVEKDSIPSTEEEERTGDWFLSVKGRQIYPLDLRPEDVDIQEIAHSLAHQCRFQGHSRDFYSVAEHSVRLSLQPPEELALCGLLHDGTEAFCGDMIRPLKRAMPQYRAIEDRIWLAVAARFGLPVELPLEVKVADNRMLQTERRDLLAKAPWAWTLDEEAIKPYDFQIHPWSPVAARARFLHEFERRGGRC